MDIQTAREIVAREDKRNADYQVSLKSPQTFDPNTGKPIPPTKAKGPTKEENSQSLIASYVISNETRVAPPKTVGYPYLRSNGLEARARDGSLLFWIDAETEQRLLREMIVEMFKNAGFTPPK